MSCSDLAPLLSAFADNELSGPERDAVEHHLLDCADCRRTLHIFRAFTSGVGAALPPLAVPTPPRRLWPVQAPALGAALLALLIVTGSVLLALLAGVGGRDRPEVFHAAATAVATREQALDGRSAAQPTPEADAYGPDRPVVASEPDLWYPTPGTSDSPIGAGQVAGALPVGSGNGLVRPLADREPGTIDNDTPSDVADLSSVASLSGAVAVTISAADESRAVLVAANVTPVTAPPPDRRTVTVTPQPVEPAVREPAATPVPPTEPVVTGPPVATPPSTPTPQPQSPAAPSQPTPVVTPTEPALVVVTLPTPTPTPSAPARSEQPDPSRQKPEQAPTAEPPRNGKNQGGKADPPKTEAPKQDGKKQDEKKNEKKDEPKPKKP